MKPNFFLKQGQPDWEVLGLTFLEFMKMCEWAFGPKWMLWPRSGLSKLWNDRHKDLFTIAGTEEVESTFKKICESWKASNK